MPKLRNKIALLYRYLIIATKRLTDKQLMILLAIVVGLAAGFATFVFERALMFFRFVLTSWFDIDTASVFYLFYPVIGIIIATLFVKYVVRDNISEGVTRVLYAMSKKGSRIKPHNIGRRGTPSRPSAHGRGRRECISPESSPRSGLQWSSRSVDRNP